VVPVGLSSVVDGEGAQALGIVPQPVFDQAMDGFLGVLPVGATLARLVPGKEFDALVDGAHGPDVEQAGPDGIDHLLVEHQVRHVRCRDDDALFSGQPLRLADGEEALDLGRNPTDSLNFAVLIDRAGHCNALAERHISERRKERVQLGRRGGITLDLVVGLLEGDSRAERERILLAVLAGQVAGEDQEALGVDRARQLDLALNALHRAAARGDAGGDARRFAKGVAAEVDDRHTVNLRFPGTGGVDHDRAVGDDLLDPLLDEVGAVFLLGDGLVNVGGLYDVVPCLASPVMRFSYHVGDVAQPAGELALVLAQPRAVLDDMSQSCAVEVAKALLAHSPADEGGIVAEVLVGPVHVRCEVGFDLEQLLEVGVELVEEGVDLWRAEQDHLDVEGERLRPQPLGRKGGVLLPQVLDRHLTADERALEGIPGERGTQDIEHLQDEETAVGPLERSRLDLVEIGDHGAEGGAVVDAANQVVVGRVALVDDRCAYKAVVVDETLTR
jgi:hypothetical protein